MAPADGRGRFVRGLSPLGGRSAARAPSTASGAMRYGCLWARGGPMSSRIAAARPPCAARARRKSRAGGGGAAGVPGRARAWRRAQLRRGGGGLRPQNRGGSSWRTWTTCPRSRCLSRRFGVSCSLETGRSGACVGWEAMQGRTRPSLKVVIREVKRRTFPEHVAGHGRRGRRDEQALLEDPGLRESWR